MRSGKRSMGAAPIWPPTWFITGWFSAAAVRSCAGLDRFIAERTGIPARVAPDALGAVAKGMLICIEHFDAWRNSLESSDDEV